ncbi:MAG: hypothetical protein N2109_12725 [Fimbriimonadales bacterium]|nr:hypothetical protein [Fimbriimonadales bacterium]
MRRRRSQGAGGAAALAALIACAAAVHGTLQSWRMASEAEAMLVRAERAESRLRALEGFCDDLAKDLDSALLRLDVAEGRVLPALREQAADPNVLPPVRGGSR